MAWNASAAAVFTADNEHIFTVTLDLSVQACKNAILSLANVAWYMLHAVSGGSRKMRLGGPMRGAKRRRKILAN